MKSLEVQLDWNEADVVSIQKYLSGYDKELTVYSGDFTADWLLSDIHSSQWIIKTSKTIEKNGGGHKYVRTLNWSRRLPDGTYFDSPENCEFLRFLQKALFVIVESSVIAPNLSIGSLTSLFNAVIPFCQWCFRPDLHLNPRSDFLARLTQERLLEYVKERVHGGLMKTADVFVLFRSKFLELSGETIESNDLFHLSPTDLNKIVHFLRSQGLYVSKNGNEVVDRGKFIEVFLLPEQITYTNKFTAFLRQLEPDLRAKHPDLMIPVVLEYEHPGHTTPLISEVISQPENHQGLLGNIKALISARSYFKQELPSSDNFRFSEIQDYINNHQLQLKHTPWIPLPLCLHIINAAVEWVLIKGEPIIDAMVDIYDGTYGDLQLENTDSRISYKALNAYAEGVLNGYRQEFDVANFDYFVRDPATLRSNPSLTYLIDILRGACLIVIAAFKPIRVNELTSLKYDCLYFQENDGFWMMHDIKKAGIRGILPEDAKPIPRVAAKAITLLQRLNDHARKHVPSKGEEDYLLYGIQYGFSWKRASIADSEYVRQRLSWFCDHIEVPLDEYGRRWYVNIHELRKSFLLNFFWAFKFSSLDSGRWMASHSNIDHIFEYIQANFAGEEMVEVESEYAYQQLRLFKGNSNLSDVSNIEEIYDDVCHHFQVNSVSEIKEGELKHWLEMQIGSGHYEIIVYGIENAGDGVGVDIVIKIS